MESNSHSGLAGERMHELSIVGSVLDQLEKFQKQHAEHRILKVGLRIGELAGVDVDCLRFGFDCLIQDSPWAHLGLEIEQVERRQRCPKCQKEFKAANWATACPECGEAATITIAGEELEIAYVEVDE